MKMNKIIVSLGGGLGNQLFQLAAGLNFAGENGEVELEWTRQKPRLNKAKKPEICSFSLPSNVRIQRGRLTSPILRKAFGYANRMGSTPRRFEKITIIKLLIQFSANLISMLHFQRPAAVFVAEGLGYFDKRPILERLTLVGYFQSYKWGNENFVKTKLKSLTSKSESTILQELESIAKLENPTIAHVRLGDYKQESNFGVLSPEYYRHAILEMSKHTNSNHVWVFSDEIDLAREYFNEMHNLEFRFISDVKDSTALTFQAMRLGSNYIIGNSTFSWWSAYLSNTEGAHVIAPKPWFRGMEDPIELHPPSWQTIDARWI